MTHPISQMSNVGCLAIGLLAGIANAQTPSVRPRFDVASIKPVPYAGPGAHWQHPPVGGTFAIGNVGLRSLIEIAWNIPDYQIHGGPGWVDSEVYEVAAKAPAPDASFDQMRLMLQTLLEERFRLAIHREPKEVPAYALLAAKNGFKLAQSERHACISLDPNAPPPGEDARGRIPCGSLSVTPTRVSGEKIVMTQLASMLAVMLRRPVIDETGFSGTFDVHLDYSADGTTAPEIFTALQEQLGLRLESRKTPVEVMIIDHAEKPSEN